MDGDDDILGIDSYRNNDCMEFDTYRQFSDLFTLEPSEGFLKVIHFNIRSYNKNIDNVLILLEDLKVKFDLIVLTEAWLECGNNLTDLEGYDVYSTEIHWNRNDGVIVYCKTELGVTSQQVSMGEATGLQLDFYTDNRHFNVVAIYRSPSMNYHSFVTDLNNYYSNVNKHTTYFYVGDINIDILHSCQNVFEKDYYLNILYSVGFTDYINKPTRVTERSETCIDHLFVNHFDYSAISSCILKTDVTDHYAIVAKLEYCSSKNLHTKTDDNETITYIDQKLLQELIERQPWDHVLALQDVNLCCDAFISTFDHLKCQATKSKYKTSRHKKLKPWITTNLIRGIRERDRLSKRVKRHPFDENLKVNYRNYRNWLNREIKSAKISYYKHKILESTGRPKEFWNIVNEISGIKKIREKFPLSLFYEKSDKDGIKKVANSFNNFFTNVGRNLAQRIPQMAGPPLVDDSAFRVRHEFRLEPITDSQLEWCIGDLRGGSAPGIDGISAILLKNNIPALIPPLKHLINLSILSGQFPDRFKIAKVVPLYKSGTKQELNNYRPISLLNVMSKILEKCVKIQLHCYLEDNNLLSECQYGFRKSKNTSDALFAMNKYISECINGNEKALTVFIDLAKAFDSIDRNILLNKMECIGIRGLALKWFSSYLNKRSQLVSINNNFSDIREIDYGVVQGSTLGPSLFLIYINNLDKLPITGKLFLFADDTAVIFKGNTWDQTFNAAQTDMFLIQKWFSQNVLSMNVLKTKYMPIFLRQSSEPPANLRLVMHVCGDPSISTCGCLHLERVDHYKYLGVILDSRLRWEPHIEYLKTKLRKLIYVFRNVREILNVNEIKMLYYAFVQSVLQYGIIVWGGASSNILKPLFVIQKLIIKIAFQFNRRFPTNLLFKNTQLLSVRQLFIKTLLVYTYSNQDLIVTPITHNYPTRGAVNVGMQVPRVFKSANLTNAFYIANFLYRNIPSEIRDLQVSLPVYKRSVSSWLSEIGLDQSETLISSVYNT